MIKRTIEISQQSVHLSVRLDQLLVQPHDAPPEQTKSIPCEDIGIVLVDHGRTTYSHHALATLVEHDAVVIVCGSDHHPVGVLMPLADHTQVVWRINDQLSISKPLKKQLWKQIVQAKILAQASNLDAQSPACRRLCAMVNEVRSGDTSNVESQAARLYWSVWLGPDIAFKRDRNRTAPAPNNMLNYGYSVMRAAVARAIVAAGMLPMIGIHHSNRSNAFCLADDLLEPLRPIIDRRVRELFVQSNRTELDQPTKAGLLETLTWRVETAGETGPLFVALHRYVASLVKCFQGETDQLSIPRLPEV